MRTSLSRREADEFQKIISLVKNLLTQSRTKEKNQIRDQSMKNLQDLIEEVWRKTERS